MHLPWSPGLQNDDRVIQSLIGFEGEEIIVTEKMDGENTTLYHDHIHARSLDSRYHPSRDWVKAFHGAVAHNILDDVRICGENMYAEHSIHYDNLESYFLGFNAWVGDRCLCWDTTIKLFDQLGITSVPVLYRGTWEDFLDYPVGAEALDGKEGFVIRVTRDFNKSEFHKVVAKYVRKNHIQTDQHWMAKAVVPNKLGKRND